MGRFGKTLQTLAVPFHLVWQSFFRATQAVSRIQELSADELAARTVGAQGLSEGLRTVHRDGIAYRHYLNREVLPALRQGFRPPLVEGFTRYLQSDISASLDKRLDEELASLRPNPYDTHPPLAQRLAALQRVPAVEAEDTSPALSLLDNVSELEAQMVSSWMAPGSAPLKITSWEDAGRNVVLAGWQNLCKKNAGLLHNITVTSLLGTVATIHEFAKKTAGPSSKCYPARTPLKSVTFKKERN